ncbi:27626_t:CDS:2, partial [Gigaspora margarita]
ECARLIQELTVITWNEMPIAQKGNIKAVDILLRKLRNHNLLFGRKIFIEVDVFHQVAPDVLDPVYSQLMDDIGDSISEVNLINNTVLQWLNGDAVELYSTDSLADDETNNNTKITISNEIW